MEHTVSVIIPVYNVEKYLEQCLAGVVGQSYKNLEIILVDDGSSDGSPAICDTYAAKDERVIVYHNPNHGPSYSRNFGIDHSRGEYLLFIDSDDWVDENYVANLVKAIEETHSELAISPYYFAYPDRSVLDSVDEKKLTGVLAEDLARLYRLTAGPCCKLYRRDIVCNKDIRFVLGRSYSEDRVFNYHYLQSIQTYVYVDIPQYHYRQNGRPSLSKQKSEKAFDDAMYALEEERKFLEAVHAKGMPQMLCWSAVGYLRTFSETKETGDSYRGFCERFQRAKGIAPVAYSFRNMKTIAASCAYIMNLPVIFYAWHRLKKYLERGGGQSSCGNRPL